MGHSHGQLCDPCRYCLSSLERLHRCSYLRCVVEFGQHLLSWSIDLQMLFHILYQRPDTFASVVAPAMEPPPHRLAGDEDPAPHEECQSHRGTAPACPTPPIQSGRAVQNPEYRPSQHLVSGCRLLTRIFRAELLAPSGPIRPYWENRTRRVDSGRLAPRSVCTA